MKRSDTAMARELDGDIVILDIPSGRYFSINNVGAFVWHLLGDPIERDDIIDAVTDEFDVDRATAASDIDALLGQLVDAGLVETKT